MSVKGVDTFWYENGNTGFMNLQLNISFTNGKVYRNTFRTGLCSSISYEDTPLIYLENILVGELIKLSTGDERSNAIYILNY